MERALHGRMRAGRCDVNEAVGFIGCHVDVTSLVEKRCSGKQHCEIDVLALDKNTSNLPNACIRGVPSYLEVSYSCLEGKCNSNIVSNFNYTFIS